MEGQGDTIAAWEDSKRKIELQSYQPSDDHDLPTAFVSSMSPQYAALNAEFTRLYQSLATFPTADDIKPGTFTAPVCCPSGLTEREKMHQMDEYLPRSSSHYGGSLPLSPYLQNTSVMVRSSNIWRNHKYALPSRLESFKKVNQMLNEQQDDDRATK